MTVTPAPPWTEDLTEVISRAMAVLRLESGDQDEQRVAEAAAAAAGLVDDYLDRGADYFTTGDLPEPVLGATVQATVEIYRRKDAPFGVASGWSVTDEMGPLRIGTDWIKGVETQISPYRLSFGVW
jgi:hypothetical protein